MRGKILPKFLIIAGVLMLLAGLFGPRAATAGYTFSFGYSPGYSYGSYSYGGYGYGYGALGYSSFYFPRTIPVGPRFYRAVSVPQLNYATELRLYRFTSRLVEVKKSSYLAAQADEQQSNEKIKFDEPIKIHIKENGENNVDGDSNSTDGFNFVPKATTISDDQTVVINEY